MLFILEVIPLTIITILSLKTVDLLTATAFFILAKWLSKKLT